MPARPSPTALVLSVACALGGLVAAAAALTVEAGAVWWVAGAVVLAWAAAAVAVARRPAGHLALLMGLVALVLGAALWASAQVATGEGAWTTARAVLTALLCGLGLHLALAVPDGRLSSSTKRSVVALGYGVSAAVGLAVDGTDLPLAPYLALAAAAGTAGLVGYLGSCRRASATDRARLEWVGWGAGLAASTGALVVLLAALLDWPGRPGIVALAATVVIPAGLVASTVPRLLPLADRVLVRTIVTVGLLAFVEAVYLFVIVGLGHSPDADERDVLVLSMVAAVVAAALVVPVRNRLEEAANQRVYGERHRPDDAVRTFAGRMSRAVPMDELLLQLAESLKKGLDLESAEVWTGTSGTFERVVSVPDRGRAGLVLAGEELGVASRAHVQGGAWLQVWLPDLLAGREGREVRAVMVAHLGELLGIIVVQRPPGATPFTDEDDRALAEVARPLGVALHNVRLDSALQASLAQLEERNEELAASRRRIVTAADDSRRAIERNLHDGAQQHLVALAVKVGLVKQLIDADRSTADAMLDELRTDVQATLDELRELAHGIYPPLLRDRGLRAALGAAATRSVLPVELVVADDLGRHAEDAEAAVYFCCLEAMQNAGKHAGEHAQLTVTITEADGRLRFDVTDDGAGFDAETATAGHGFVNMRDRLGAVGGDLVVESTPGSGSRVGGWVPAAGPDRADGEDGETGEDEEPTTVEAAPVAGA